MLLKHWLYSNLPEKFKCGLMVRLEELEPPVQTSHLVRQIYLGRETEI